MDRDMHDAVRRMPLPAYILCSNFHNRKIVETDAQSLNETTIHSPGRLKCQQDGPKYKAEHLDATKIATCLDGDSWNYPTLWICWCAEKFADGMIDYLHYRVCAKTMLVINHRLFPGQKLNVVEEHEGITVDAPDHLNPLSAEVLRSIPAFSMFERWKNIFT